MHSADPHSQFLLARYVDMARRLLHSQYVQSMVVKVLGAVLSFGTTLMIARLSGARVSGEYALAVQTVQTGSVIALFGNDQLLVRRMAGDLADGREDLARAALTHAIKLVCTLAILVCLGLVALSPFAASLGTSPKTLIASTLGLVSFAMLGLIVATMRAIDKVVLSQFFYGVVHSAIIVTVLGAIALAGHPLTVATIVLTYVMALAATALIGGFIVELDIRHWPRTKGGKAKYKAISSGFIGGTLIIHMLTGWLGMTVIARMVGMADLGAFRVCNQLITVLTMIFTTVDSVVSPHFARAFRTGDTAQTTRRYLRSVQILGLFAGPPILALMIFPHQILAIFGPYFVVATDALRILVLGQLVNVATGPVGSYLIMAGKERINFRLALVGLVITLVLLVSLTPRFGLVGVAWAVTASGILRNLVGLVFVLQHMRAQSRMRMEAN